MTVNADLTVKRKSLAEEVAARLRQQISSGEFSVGQKLPTEVQLMRACGVGRSSIREAIKILSNSGMLSVRQGLGTFVVSQSATEEPIGMRFSRADASDLDDVRQVLEMKIAEKAALNRTKADIKEIKKALDEIREADFNGTIDECIDADIAFHAALARASHNGILLEFYQMASERLRQWYRTIYSSPEIFASAYDLHDELYRSILQRNPQGAWDAAEAIIKHGRL